MPSLSTRKLSDGLFAVVYGGAIGSLYIWRDDAGHWRLMQRMEDMPRGGFRTLYPVDCPAHGLTVAARHLESPRT